MILEIIIAILSLLVVIFGYTTFNLLRKNEKAEDIIVQYNEYLTEFNKQIKFTNDRLKKIDNRGTFESDDEIGWFFKQIKNLQEGIDKFRIN
jgi:peptidoglycan hydrolase CwlO-like protein